MRSQASQESYLLPLQKKNKKYIYPSKYFVLSKRNKAPIYNMIVNICMYFKTKEIRAFKKLYQHAFWSTLIVVFRLQSECILSILYIHEVFSSVHPERE